MKAVNKEQYLLNIFVFFSHILKDVIVCENYSLYKLTREKFYILILVINFESEEIRDS